MTGRVILGVNRFTATGSRANKTRSEDLSVFTITNLKTISTGILEEGGVFTCLFVGRSFNVPCTGLDSDCSQSIPSWILSAQHTTRPSLPTPLSSIRGRVLLIGGCFKIHPAPCLLHLRLYLLFQSMYQLRFILHAYALSFLAASSQFPLILDIVSFWQAPCSI